MKKTGSTILSSLLNSSSTFFNIIQKDVQPCLHSEQASTSRYLKKRDRLLFFSTLQLDFNNTWHKPLSYEFIIQFLPSGGLWWKLIWKFPRITSWTETNRQIFHFSLVGITDWRRWLIATRVFIILILMPSDGQFPH